MIIRHPSQLEKDFGEPDLIGIEWEPQVTLLEYPEKPVFIEYNKDMFSIRKDDTKIVIDVPSWFSFVYCDIISGTLEIRSTPVPLHKIEQEIKRHNIDVKFICRTLASEFGPCGIFLPDSVYKDQLLSTVLPPGNENAPAYMIIFLSCTKHVSYSWSNVKLVHISDRKFDENSDEVMVVPVRLNGRFMQSKDSRINDNGRLHVKVPYNHLDYRYSACMEIKTIDFNSCDKPTILGYSYTGEEYIMANSLS